MLERIDSGEAMLIDLGIMASVRADHRDCLCALGDAMAMPIG